MNKLAQEILMNRSARNQNSLEKTALESTNFTPWEN
jgi:hypothetical protein